jgi:thiamine biosynthesis protein ThiS
VLVNGKKETVRGARTLDDLLLELGYEKSSVAVARDGSFVPKRDYAELVLEEEMDLEILLPMQGG